MARRRDGGGADRVAEARGRLVRQVIDDMAELGAGWSKAWCNGAPRNPATGTRYKGRNNLLLTFYMREAHLTDPRFVTYRQAQERGWHVRRGAKSLPIEKWGEVFVDARDPKRRIAQPKTAAEREALRKDPDVRSLYVPLGCYSVFAARDVEGMPAWEGLNPAVETSRLADFLVANGPVEVDEVPGDMACYLPKEDRIEMPSRSLFTNEEAFARVLLHEQGHATGHPSRLDRDQSGLMVSEDPESRARYAREELVAELNSLFCANELGVSMPEVGRDDAFSKSAYWQRHVSYLTSWSSRLEDPEGELMRAASAAGRATDWLMGNCFAPALAKDSPDGSRDMASPEAGREPPAVPDAARRECAPATGFSDGPRAPGGIVRSPTLSEVSGSLRERGDAISRRPGPEVGRA